MIKIQCDICKEDTDSGYVTRRTWGVFPTIGYADRTIHVCQECNKRIQDFIRTITREQ